MNCPKCGEHNYDHWKDCAYCGESLNSTDQLPGLTATTPSASTARPPATLFDNATTDTDEAARPSLRVTYPVAVILILVGGAPAWLGGGVIVYILSEENLGAALTFAAAALGLLIITVLATRVISAAVLVIGILIWFGISGLSFEMAAISFCLLLIAEVGGRIGSVIFRA